MTANADKLARQIGVIQAAVGVRFNQGNNVPENIDVLNYVAAFLDRQGLQDVRDLRVYANADANLHFWFDIRTGSILRDTGSGGGTVDDVAWHGVGGYADVLTAYEGRWDSYYIKVSFTPDGYPVFWSLNIAHHNAWAETFRAVAQLAGIAVAVAFPALAATIGNAVMGAELAAAYPAVASGLGNVAIQTTLSGGDVQSAVVSSLSGGFGAGIGGFVAGATDSAIIGSAVGAATKTALVGGNIGEAVAGSLIGSGIRNGASLFTSVIAPAVPEISGGDMGLGEWGGWGDDLPPLAVDLNLPAYDPISGAASTFDNPQWWIDPVLTGGVFDATPLSSPWSIDPYGSVLGVDPTNPPPSPSGVVASSGGADLTNLALTALRVVTSWHSAGQPAPRASNATTQANANGTLSVRNPNGTVSTVKMPAGTPYLTTGGQLVTNNGDGTFSSIDSRGVVSTQPYAASTSGLSSLLSFGSGASLSPMVIAAGAVALLLVLRK